MWEIFEEYDYELSGDILDKLDRLYNLLIEGNEKISLTTITDYDEVILKHYLDSAAPLLPFDEDREYIPSDHTLTDEEMAEIPSEIQEFYKVLNTKNLRVLDVGTGAGFPGLVLAILNPDWNIVLLESQQKKITYLNHVIKELSLDNVETIHGRAEDIAQDPEYREQFDVVTSRAVAELRVLLELCIPFLTPHGFFIAYKGPQYDDELEASYDAQEKLNCRISFVEIFNFPDMMRTLVGFRMIGTVPEKYPRRAGIPNKKPL